MKFSYRTHPALKYLESKNLDHVSCFNCDIDVVKPVLETVEKRFAMIAYYLNEKAAYYLSKPFLEAYEKAGDRLYQSYLWPEIEDDAFCFLLPGGQATAIAIKHDKMAGVIVVFYTDFFKHVLVGQGKLTLTYKDGDFDYKDEGWKSENTKEDGHILNCLVITLFIKYANIDVKELKAGQRVKGVDCKYVNETKSSIKQFDITWFTSLVKSDGFNVRGHFRLQPKKKNGEWTKELIWINEFQKSGYARRAGKVIEEENSKGGVAYGPLVMPVCDAMPSTNNNLN